MMQENFFKYKFTSELLYIGERIKKGTFKPSISSISSRYKKADKVNRILPLPYSTVTGALCSMLGDKRDIHAIGKITKYEREYTSVAPSDIALDNAKLTITIEYLSNVEGEIYIRKTNDFSEPLSLRTNEINLGGLKSKGFGKCKVIFDNEFEAQRIKGKGIFLSRIYYDDAVLNLFGIRKEDIEKRYLGYLFKKTTPFDGYYQLSLFENSIIKNCFNFLAEEI